jgi:TonB family protein
MAQQLATITPPRLKTDSAAVYPERALRDHVHDSVTVALVLEIGSDGYVRRANVVEPRGHGFDDAAVSAAFGLVFEPATRDGRPIAAKIKYQYNFTPPAPRLSGRVAGQVSDLPIRGANVTIRDAAGKEYRVSSDSEGRWQVEDIAPGRAHLLVTASGMHPQESDEELAPGEATDVVSRLSREPLATSATPPPETEVEVRGDRPPREVSKRTLTRDEIRHSAGTMGDALLSIQNLPGVARPPPFSGNLVVRGSGPDETGVFVDGTEVPLIYHFGGLSSAVPSELLEKIDFYPGNYSALYGRGMGGVIDVRLRDPKKDGYHFLAENSFLGLRLLAEGPLAKGWTFFASGQRSWLDVLLSPLVDEATALPVWGDYQFALQKNFADRSSFRLLFFGSDDAFKLVSPTANAANPSLSGALGYHTSFWRAQARFESRFSENTELRLTAAYGLDALDFNLGTNMGALAAHPLSGRAELSQRLVRGVVANIGADILYEPYDLSLQLPPPSRPGMPDGGPGQPPIRTDGSSSLFRPGAYTELEVVPWRGARAVPAMRLDYDSSTRRWDFAPRLNLRQDLSAGYPRTTLKGGLGRYYQPPDPLQTDPRYGERGLSSNRSLHVDVGLEQEFTRNLELSLDGFYKKFDHLVVPGAANAGSGAAYGVEWLLRYKPDGHFFGWISYTLSRTERRDLPSEPLRIFQYDQTHVLTVLGNYNFGHGWQLGARFRFGSGDLETPLTTGAYNATAGSQLPSAAYPPFGSRYPAFHQLDLRVERSKRYRYFRITTYLDLQNAYFANNPLARLYDYKYTKSSFVHGLPIFPVFGARLELP